MRGGQPSITTPMPPPWDSPNVVTRNNWPNVLPMSGKNKSLSLNHNAQSAVLGAHAPRVIYGRGGGVGRTLGVGIILGVGEGRGVNVGVADGVSVAVAVGVGVS